MLGMHHFGEELPVGVGFNSRNWIATTKELFAVRILTNGENPNDTHPGLTTDLLFAQYGGRAAFAADTRARFERVSAAEERVKAAQESGGTPTAEDIAILRIAEDDPPLDPATLAKLDTEVPSDPAEYVWLNPWKQMEGKDLAKTAKINMGIYATFGRKGIDPRVDGLLVCEISLLKVVTEVAGQAVEDPNGVLLERFRIDRPRSTRGPFEYQHTFQPFMNRSVMYDYMMSFVRQKDDRQRILLVEFFAPDEETYEWKPVYNATFGVDYRFTSIAFEAQYHSPEYMQVGVEQTAEVALAARNARLRQVQGTLKANAHVAIFTSDKQRETRLIPPQSPSAALSAERAQWLYGDASKVFGGLKRERGTEDDADLQSAILTSLEEQAGASSGAGSSNS